MSDPYAAVVRLSNGGKESAELKRLWESLSNFTVAAKEICSRLSAISQASETASSLSAAGLSIQPKAAAILVIAYQDANLGAATMRRLGKTRLPREGGTANRSEPEDGANAKFVSLGRAASGTQALHPTRADHGVCICVPIPKGLPVPLTVNHSIGTAQGKGDHAGAVTENPNNIASSVAALGAALSNASDWLSSLKTLATDIGAIAQVLGGKGRWLDNLATFADKVGKLAGFFGAAGTLLGSSSKDEAGGLSCCCNEATELAKVPSEYASILRVLLSMQSNLKVIKPKNLPQNYGVPPFNAVENGIAAVGASIGTGVSAAVKAVSSGTKTLLKTSPHWLPTAVDIAGLAGLAALAVATDGAAAPAEAPVAEALAANLFEGEAVGAARVAPAAFRAAGTVAANVTRVIPAALRAAASGAAGTVSAAFRAALGVTDVIQAAFRAAGLRTATLITSVLGAAASGGLAHAATLARTDKHRPANLADHPPIPHASLARPAAAHGDGRPLQVTMNVDGKQLAKIMVRHLNAWLDTNRAAGAGFDASAGFSQVSLRAV